MSAKVRLEAPALSLIVEQACVALSVCYDFWRQHIALECA